MAIGASIKQIPDEVRTWVISQLINDISRVLQKLVTIILASFMFLFPILPAILVLN